jgi:predicted dehydrogenase
MARLRMAVIGVGHLGKEHARILSTLPGAELVGVADANAEQAKTIAKKCSTRAFTDHRELLPLVEAAVIAVPTTVHYPVAKDFLKAGIPVLVEKPITPTVAEAEELCDLSRKHGAILQVGHIERFNPAVVDLEKRKFQPKYIEGERLSNFSGRSLDVGVVLDLMIHDLDVVTVLVRSEVKHVEAVGVSLFGQAEDIANARITFVNGCVANLTASRVSITPKRRMRIFSPEGYVGLDFYQRHATIIQPSEKVKSDGLDFSKLDLSMVGLLKEKLFGHYLEIREFSSKEGDQLTAELQHFVDCVRTGRQPKVTGEDGRNAVALALRIQAKINAHQWNGTADGPVGPRSLPLPLGPMFMPSEKAA